MPRLHLAFASLLSVVLRRKSIAGIALALPAAALIAFLLPTSSASASSSASPLPPPAAALVGDDWTLQLGGPAKDGTFGVSITVEWVDAVGKTQAKTISAKADVAKTDTPDAKRQKVQDALTAALAKNQVGGANPVTLTGGGSSVIMDPNQSQESSMSIDKVTTSDNSKEHDRAIKPVGDHVTGESLGLAVIQAVGSITGKDLPVGIDSIFEVVTDAGVFSVTLDGGMTKSELLRTLADDMAEQGITTWFTSNDERLPLLYVLVDATVGGIGATTSDSGLTASMTLAVQRD